MAGQMRMLDAGPYFPVFWRNFHSSVMGMPCTFDNKVIFKGGHAAPFVSWMKTEILLLCNHDPAAFICAQRGRGTRARFNSVHWRPRISFTGSSISYFTVSARRKFAGVACLMLADGATKCPWTSGLPGGQPLHGRTSGVHTAAPAHSAECLLCPRSLPAGDRAGSWVATLTGCSTWSNKALLRNKV